MIKKLCMAVMALALGTASAMATVDKDSVYVEDAAIAPGQSGTLTVKIMNKSSVQSVGMYITLPEGVTADAASVALNATLAPVEKDTIAANNINGACRVAVLGKAGEAFQDYEGTLFTIPVTVASTVEAGTYDITVSNAELSTTSNAVINLGSAVAKLTVGGVKGDVDGSGKVDISDVNAVIAIMCGTAGETDYKGNAHVAGNDRVDISDVNAIIAIMCGNAAKSAMEEE